MRCEDIFKMCLGILEWMTTSKTSAGGRRGITLHNFGKVVLRDASYKPWTLLKMSRGNMQCFGAKAKTVDPTGLRGSAT